MPQYVLRHGSISNGTGNVSAGVPLKPSDDPASPTLVEMSEADAARVNANANGQLLPNVKPKPPPLQLKAEYDAELAATAAGEKARADVLAKAKAAAEPKHGKESKR